MRKISISLAQMEVIPGDKERNLRKGSLLIEEAARRGSQVILFPELWFNGYPLERTADTAEPITGEAIRKVQELAALHRIAVIGSFLERRDDGVYNSAPVISEEGEILGVYTKTHLFSYVGEDRYLKRGNSLPIFEFPWGKAAVAICYDLRFPELFRMYMEHGAEVIFVPAEWPRPRTEHWSLFLRLRAIENLFFTVGCNRVGRDGSPAVYEGASAAYSPWGEVVALAGNREMLLTFEIDMDEVKKMRDSFPALRDRRKDLFERHAPEP